METAKPCVSQNEFVTVPTTDAENFETRETKRNETTCGIGTWKPKWLQWFATQQHYIVIYCILSILQGAYFTYFIGIITTLEKRFSFKSRISTSILIANNISPILICLVINFFEVKNHRPKWIAGSTMVTVVSCFMSIFPYFIYGKGTFMLNSGNSSYSAYDLTDYDLCEANPQRSENCNKINHFTTESVVVIFFLASFLEGIGSTVFYALGTPYLSDNVKKKDSLYFDSVYSLKIFGQCLGFILASICLRYFENPSYDPGFDNYDPRWIGAWWMGFLVLALLLLTFSFPMFLFPSRLAGGKVIMQNQIIPSTITKVKEMYQSLKRLSKNPLLVCHTFSMIFYLMGSFGYYIFMPKYIESQFQQSVFTAIFFAGSTSILSYLVGILGGWYLIYKFYSKPRKFVRCTAIMQIFTLIGFIMLMIFGCHNIKISGISENPYDSLFNDCNKDCECDKTIFKPICDTDGISTYFSPCFAGCSGINNTIYPLVYTNCKCLYDDKQRLAPSNATDGFCSSNCNMFLTYIIILSLSMIISSTARFGNSSIMSRCMEPKDKSLAVVTVETVLPSLAFIFYLLIFGSITDSTCLIWKEECSRVGNCWFYDFDKFRYYLHAISASLILIGVIFDLAVYFMSEKGGFYNVSNDLPPVDLSKLPIENEEEDVIYSKIPEYQKTAEWK
ncbi:solute carrier organic anion transporter family member 4C1-like [Centruroides sculpturatus]|uniref:solute carrier organic anion transporter family member 4C1-like n=1 Tax=Centruroides sculpturatus TaxID=218467 RepID=UPI000C6D366B|nr:solute carrier organic anion transporter family member 4C1-like [Centruroides sculpturatus]